MSAQGTRSNRNIVVAIVIIVVLVIAASLAYVATRRPISTTTSTSTTSQSTSPTQTTTSLPSPPPQQTLSITWANVPVLDPAIGNDEASTSALVNLYDTLVRPAPSGGLVPDLATSWSVSSDGLTYTFHLRSNVTFHNGDILTANDVVFSMQRMITMGQGNSYLFSPYVANITAPDNMTVVITLKKPFAPFIDTLPYLFIVDKKQVMSNLGPGPYGSYGDYGSKWLLTHDAGSGPYEVYSVNLESNVILVEYTNYWNGTMPHQPKYVNFIGSNTPSTVQALFSSKQIQITDQWQTYSTIASLSSLQGAAMAKIPEAYYMFLMVNTQRPPTDDVHIREAIYYMLNYTAITTEIFPGQGIPSGIIPPNLPGADPSLPTAHQDLALAKQLVQQSKYAKNLSQYPILYMYTTAVPPEAKLAALFQSEAAQIGLSVQIEGVPWPTMEAYMSNESVAPNVVSVETAPTYLEAGSYLQEMYTSQARGTYYQNFWFNSTLQSELDSEIANAVMIQNQTARFEAYYKIQEQIFSLYVAIPVFQVVEIRAYYPAIVTWYAANGQSIPLLGYNFMFREFDFNPSAMPS